VALGKTEDTGRSLPISFQLKLLPDSFCRVLRDGREREGMEWVVREGVGAGGRNDPSTVCTYE
jgi:hypothetical protein